MAETERDSLAGIDRALLDLLRARMRYKDAHPKETTRARDLLSREEQKDLGYTSASAAFLRMMEALCEAFPESDPYFFYPDLVRRKIGETKNEFSRLSAFGCVLSDPHSMPRIKKLQPACRAIGFESATSLLSALGRGEVQYAFVRLEDREGSDNALYEWIRRNHVFLIGSHVFGDRSRYGILSSGLSVYPDADRIAVSLRIPADDISLSRLYSCFFSSDYLLLRANTFPAMCRDRMGVQLEIGIHSYREEIFFLLDLLDHLFDECVLEGIFYQKENLDL